MPAPATRALAPLEAALPPDPFEPPEVARAPDALDVPLFLRVVVLDPFLLREAVPRALPLRELLALVRALPELPFERFVLLRGLEPLAPLRDFEALAPFRDFDAPLDLRADPPDDDLDWVLGDVVLDERALAWAITLTFPGRRPLAVVAIDTQVASR